MTHRGPFQPLLFCDSVKDIQPHRSSEASGFMVRAIRDAHLPRWAMTDALSYHYGAL